LSDVKPKRDEADSNVIHVYPVSEENLHSLDGRECFCNPDVELFDGGRELVIHRRVMQ
jgi:hypothetical protein